MAEYKKYNQGGPKRPFSKPSFGGKPSFQKELYDAECNSCHKRCQVPFRPNGKKPVYCTDCFSKQDGRDSRDTRTSTFSREPRFERNSSPTPNREIQELKRELQAMNATLQKLVSSLETSNRSAALSEEVRKHVPAEPTKAKKTAPKKAPKKAVKKAAKKKA